MTHFLFGVQAQRLDVNARGDHVLEQRDLVDVDGQELTLRQSDQRQRAPLPVVAMPGETDAVMGSNLLVRIYVF